ncbi:fungal-specific transcription factor domain-containing protein [Trametes meyenii]|nr:fungal-specific transcription factor domain-containing protein [Trametes meyenii]
MRCTFLDSTDDICSRCAIGKYECVFPGRKPRSPGMRTTLQQQIREKTAMIDKVLKQVNPGPIIVTSLALVPARLPLNEEERSQHSDVLAYLERAASQPSTSHDGSYASKFDLTTLEGAAERDIDSEDEVRENASNRTITSKGDVRAVKTTLEATAPTGLIATVALEARDAAAEGTVSRLSSDDEDTSDTSGVDCDSTSDTYFLPGPSANLELRRLIVERQALPDILLSGLVTSGDAIALFHIYYQRINPIIPILDEHTHTPTEVLARCPFLFTVVCMVASKHYQEKPHMYSMAAHFAKAAAANTLLDGWKTIEICQAFTLLGMYSPPVQRLEENRAWSYTGIASRLAMALGLSRTPPTPPTLEEEREMHNRTRMWMVCYILDRCLSIQSGKAWMVPEDMTIRNASQWYQNHEYHNESDKYLVSLVELLRIASRFVSTVNPVHGTSATGSMKTVDFGSLYQAYEDEFSAWKTVIDVRHGEKEPKEPTEDMQITIIHRMFNYCRLVVCCYCLQLTSRQSIVRPDKMLTGCLQAATSLIKLTLEGCTTKDFAAFLPEILYMQSAFAAVILAECSRMNHNTPLDIEQEERIVGLIGMLCQAWGSNEGLLDGKHAAHLYSHFLKQLMGSHIARLAERKERETQLPRAHMAHKRVPATCRSTDPGFPASTDYGPQTSTENNTFVTAFGHLYQTDVDVSKAARELGAASSVPVSINTDQPFFASKTESGGHLNDALGDGDFDGITI